MRNLSSTTGPVSYGETSWETGDAPEAATGKSHYQELIHQANTVPLTHIFRHYNLRLDPVRCVITCPFKFHKGGRESSASFKYFANTNSFHCFGCKTGGEWAHGCEFVAKMDNISRAQAALKILSLFGSEVDESIEPYDGQNFSERLDLMLDFSNVVREFRFTYPDEKASLFIEKVCRVYDTLNFRHNLDNDALRRCVEELKEEINNYKPCLSL